MRTKPNDRMGQIPNFAEALHLNYQDLSLDELEGLGKGKKDPDSDASLLKLSFRNNLKETEQLAAAGEAIEQIISIYALRFYLLITL